MRLNLYTKGISRDNWHKRRKTGGKRKPVHKKRKYELGRPPANTKVNIFCYQCLCNNVGDENTSLGWSFLAVLVKDFDLPMLGFAIVTDTWPSSKYVFIGLCHVLYIHSGYGKYSDPLTFFTLLYCSHLLKSFKFIFFPQCTHSTPYWQRNTELLTFLQIY